MADIASSGTADYFVRASHVTRTRHAHHVIVADLHILLQQGYFEDCTPADAETKQQADCQPFEELRTQPGGVQIDYWLKTLSLKLLLLWYIRSFTRGTFNSMWNL